jgi:hypothetical protein
MASLSTIFKFWTLLSVTRTMASTSTGPNNTHTPFTSDVNIQDEAHRLVVETCLKLHTHQPNLVTLPCHNKDQFNHLSTQNWSQTVWQQPACVATPTCAADVSLLIKTLVQAKVPFAIRSGGHSPNRGDASIDGAGVLLSLHRLNHITYDAGTKLASIGPGARWDDVYTELDKYNVTVVGGRVMSVGVGGLVLGGGLSYLSDVHGLVCDNIVAYEVRFPLGGIIIRDCNVHVMMLTGERARWFWPTGISLKPAKHHTRICFGRSRGAAITLVRRIPYAIYP